MESLYLSLGAAVLALLFAALIARQVLSEDPGDETMQRIGVAIQEGARAFLQREYTFLAAFVVVVVIVLAVFVDFDVLDRFGADGGELAGLPRTAISYLLGAIASASAGYIGMYVAVRANVRTAAKARQGLNPALRVAFSSGTVMGVTVTGLSLLCISVLYLLFQDVRPLTGFAFGASSIALFARVGGGIYTKAADVGADLVGKIEAGIPEDDPRNPATIADNVGDNVGDVAGMGADLFESYTGSIVATMSLAAVAVIGAGENAVFDRATDLADHVADPFVLPLLVMAVGIVASILGTFLVRSSEDASIGRLLWALRAGIFSASGMVLVGTAAIVIALDLDWNLFWAVVTGLVAGQVIGTVTEYYTAYEYSPDAQAGGAGGDGRRHDCDRRAQPGHALDGGPAADDRGRDLGHLRARRPLRHRAGGGGHAFAARHYPGQRRLRPGRGQRRRHRRAGRAPARGAGAHRRPGQPGQHQPPPPARASLSALRCSPRWR